MNLLVILIAATAIQGTFLVVSLLISKHSYKVANYLLSGLIVLFTYYALVKILSNTNEIYNFPHFIRSYRPVFILVCVLVFFYCKALTTPGFRFAYRDGIHLVPLVLYMFATLPFFLSDPAAKIASLSSQPFSLSWGIERGFFVAVFLFYFGLSVKTILRHQQRIKDIFSNIERVKLDWLRNLLLAFGVIWILALIRFLSAYGSVGYENKFAVPILLCLTIYLIGWYALRQPEIFDDRWERLIRDIDEESTAVAVKDDGQQKEPVRFEQHAKYEYSSLDKQSIVRYKDLLLDYLDREKSYADPDLKLQDLADHLGIPSYQVSQVINTELQQNFYDLVNSSRVDEAKRRLADPEENQFTITTIAFDAGFNSKSTFNAAFKKYTNMTPSQFRRSRAKDSGGGVRSKVAH